MTEPPSPISSAETSVARSVGLIVGTTTKYLREVMIYAISSCRCWQHGLVVERARIALGSKMELCGIGPAELLSELQTVQQDIERTKASGGSLGDLNRLRRRLRSQLAVGPSDEQDSRLSPEQNYWMAVEQRQGDLVAECQRCRDRLRDRDVQSRRGSLIGIISLVLVAVLLVVMLRPSSATTVAKKTTKITATKAAPVTDVTATPLISSQPQPLSFEVSGLWVKLKTTPHDTLSYGASPIKVEYRRSADQNVPPQIGIVEDTPVGTGAVMRSAVWQAAIAAALLRNDDLAGVDVMFRFQGRIDGPSAGGILCLALLSCLEGKTVPNDLAFTGTILPDGTIGLVSGIAHKLAAAKKRGCRRVIVPSFVRFQEDLETGELVDLHQLAKSLDLTLFPAESIDDAYRFAHGLPASQADHAVMQIESLPQQVEEWLKSQYEQHHKVGDQIFEKLPEAERSELLADTVFLPFLESRHQAESAYRSGRLLHAFDQITQWSGLLQAREQNKKFMDGLVKKSQTGQSPISLANLRKDFDVAIKQAFQQCPDEIRLVEEASKNILPIGSQHFTEIGTVPLAQAYAAIFESYLDPKLKQIRDAKPEDLGDGVTKESAAWNVALNNKALQLILANLARTRLTESVQEQSHLASVLPPSPRSPMRSVAVAKFFHSGFLATHESLEASIKELASANGISHGELGERLFEADIDYSILLSRIPTCERLQEKIMNEPPNSQQQQFFAVLGAQVSAHRIAESAGLVVRWSELDVTKNADDSWKYERVEVLSFMLRRARESAIKNLARCHRARVPCPEALLHLQAAESQRDDPSTDKVSVLVEYWKASLQAQALCMLFSPGQ